MSILETVLSHETVVPMEKLTEITVTEDTNCLELDMTGNRWAEFNFVVLRIHPVDGDSKSYYGYVNDGVTYATYETIVKANSTQSSLLYAGNTLGDTLAVYFISKGGCSSVHGIALTTLFLHSSYLKPLSQIQSISFGNKNDSEFRFRAGTTLEVWGIL